MQPKCGRQGYRWSVHTVPHFGSRDNIMADGANPRTCISSAWKPTIAWQLWCSRFRFRKRRTRHLPRWGFPGILGSNRWLLRRVLGRRARIE